MQNIDNTDLLDLLILRLMKTYESDRAFYNQIRAALLGPPVPAEPAEPAEPAAAPPKPLTLVEACRMAEAFANAEAKKIPAQCSNCAHWEPGSVFSDVAGWCPIWEDATAPTDGAECKAHRPL